MAALAAGRQNKFWEFHDELFKDYNRLNEQKVQEIVTQLGLDQKQFDEHKKSPVEAARIRQDYEEGIKDPVGMSGVKMEADFHIITAQTNAINNKNDATESWNLARSEDHEEVSALYITPGLQGYYR